MERLGISSACYYPLTTEESFMKACKAEIKCIELFFNSPSELSDEFISNIKTMQNEFGVSIPSVHPFMSFAESFFLFSSYERRFFDILDLYKRFFEIMNELKSDIFIIHGSKIPGSISDEKYFERFAKLIEIGKSFNIQVCQENVVDYRSQSVDYIEMMKNYIGSDFGMVLDIKQARRATQNPDDFINRLGNYIKHVHISDYNESSTCIPPMEGHFDFIQFFNSMKNIGYTGKYIIELYNHSYTNEEQIYESYKKINKLLIDY
ncbi:MAG: sugar phosphate isomerase/epimerase [Clostridia bacterium]|nr:sugar phosphate isomerase/epimerase [Clostridia bacterium]